MMFLLSSLPRFRKCPCYFPGILIHESVGFQDDETKRKNKATKKKKQRQMVDAKFICTSNLNCTLASTVVVLFYFVSISDDYDEHVN